jgi:hypothetical protein
MINAGDIETALKAPPYNFAITTVRSQGGVFSAEATNPNDQAAVDAALPTVISDLEDAEAAVQANQAALADMIATFVVTPEAIAYFNTLQLEIRSVSNNNSILIGAVFPAMRTILQNDGDTNLYQRYLNLLRVTAGISEATFIGSPTTAQQHNAVAVAQDFANAGMIQMIAGVLFG